MDVCRASLLLLFFFIVGCTAATPTVFAIGSQFLPFSISQSEITVDELSDLNAVVVTAQCFMGQSQFYLESPDVSPAMTPIPFSNSTFTAPITAVVNNCSTTQTLQVTLNLNGVADFNTIIGTNGAFRTLRFQDQNMTGLNFTDELRIVYSTFNSFQERFIFGQGNNNTICQGPFCLKGRVVNVMQSQEISNAPFTLKGRVVYQ
jgi:hypothetical protein